MARIDTDKITDPIFIEAENFSCLGGWVVDQQSYETLGSSYVLAHGLGKPVADARTEFTLKTAGKRKIWVRTRDWTAAWNTNSHAGKFAVAIDGVTLSDSLGTNGDEWDWQYVGEIELSVGNHEIALKDLTGFDGRCDCVYIGIDEPPHDAQGLTKLREAYAPEPSTDETRYDLIVVGGGIAGICLAYSAIRSGVKTLLINDRPVLGGCNSSEIRVCMGGMRNLPPYENVGNVLRAIEPLCGSPSTFDAKYYEDERKLNLFDEISAADCVKLNLKAISVDKRGDKIDSVVCVDVLSGRKTRYFGTLFADCSGDAILARLGGAEVFYGREASSRYGESLAPDVDQKLVMGHSLRWYATQKDHASDFPDIDWGFDFDENTYMRCTSGDWEQETGFTRDMVTDVEYIRDYGLRAIYSNWSYQKNHCTEKEKFSNYELEWVSPLGGKRESYRVRGDLVLTQNDIENAIKYDDETACITWSIDMHFPEPENQKAFGEAFRSCAYHRGVVQPYPVPYRCLYSHDISNLFLGGRIISASHVAFSAIRVMRTLGQLGEVAGIAAGICIEHDCTPREVYTHHLQKLKAKLSEGIDVRPAFECAVGNEEAYHFKDLGWIFFDKNRIDSPDKIDEYSKRIKPLGIKHKYPVPEELKNTLK